MATVTGLTKDRMLQIEGASIVSARQESGELILTNFAGVDTNVGDIVGPGITKVLVQYQAGTSATTRPTGAWRNDPPGIPAGQYLWVAMIISHAAGSDTVYYPVLQPKTVDTGWLPIEVLSPATPFSDPPQARVKNGIVYLTGGFGGITTGIMNVGRIPAVARLGYYKFFSGGSLDNSVSGNFAITGSGTIVTRVSSAFSYLMLGGISYPID